MDLDPSSVTSGGWLEDTSLVEKYKISDEAYEKRDGKFSQTLIICNNRILIIAYFRNLLMKDFFNLVLLYMWNDCYCLNDVKKKSFLLSSRLLVGIITMWMKAIECY